MLIVLIIVSIIISILVLLFTDYPEDNPLTWLTSIIVCISLFFGTICIVEVVGERTIDKKIQMYQEENSQIEQKVKETVRTYMNYEEKTYKELIETADLTTVIIKYPELNSNELIKIEIDLYIQNNKKIKELKEDKINIDIYKWWLYFGKSNEVNT